MDFKQYFKKTRARTSAGPYSKIMDKERREGDDRGGLKRRIMTRIGRKL